MKRTYVNDYVTIDERPFISFHALNEEENYSLAGNYGSVNRFVYRYISKKCRSVQGDVLCT